MYAFVDRGMIYEVVQRWADDPSELEYFLEDEHGEAVALGGTLDTPLARIRLAIHSLRTRKAKDP